MLHNSINPIRLIYNNTFDDDISSYHKNKNYKILLFLTAAAAACE